MLVSDNIHEKYIKNHTPSRLRLGLPARSASAKAGFAGQASNLILENTTFQGLVFYLLP